MRVKIEAGAEFDTVTPAEMSKAFTDFDRRLMARGQGIKPRRFGPLSGIVAGGAVSFGGDTVSQGNQTQYGPTQGNFWSVRLLIVNGLASGATPDILNIGISGAGAGFNWWQVNGNSFGSTFGMFELFLFPGEYLAFSNQGTITAAAGTLIAARGIAMQIPEEKAYLLLGGSS